MKDHIFELRRKIWIYGWSSQYTHNLNSCELKPEKKIRPERDSSLWPLRYRCSALPTELSSHLGGGHGIRAHDLCDTGAVLYRLSYQGIWELVTLRVSGFNFTTAQVVCITTMINHKLIQVKKWMLTQNWQPCFPTRMFQTVSGYNCIAAIMCDTT